MRRAILAVLTALTLVGCASTTFRDRYETLSREFDSTADELDRARVELQSLQAIYQAGLDAGDPGGPELLARIESARLKIQLAEQKAERLELERNRITDDVEREEEEDRKNRGIWSTLLASGGTLLLSLVGGAAKRYVGA